MKRSIFFIVLLLIISVYYNYPEILGKRPQSVHAWRQADCASIALNYSSGGMNFFQPEVHNLTSDNGTSGKAATSEIPFLYFFVAVLYRLFGYHELIFRLVNSLIFLTGLYYLFKLSYKYLNDYFWGIFIPLLLFASPVIAYYANNFISNTPALGITLIAWYFFFQYVLDSRRRYLWISILFFFLAASLKITALLSFLAIAGIFILEVIVGIRFRKGEKIIDHPLIYLFSTAVVLLLVASWIIYASWYNNVHDCTYFSTVTFPLWKLDKEAVSGIFESIRLLWYYEYYHISAYLLFAGMLVFILFHLKTSDKFLLWILLFITSGTLFYMLLQFWTFKDHDYYTINLYILPVWIMLTFFDCLKNNHPRLFSSNYLKGFFLIILLFNVYYTKSRLNERYEGWWMEESRKLENFYTISAYLRDIGIGSKDTVISIAGNSHISLYLMNMKGWTEHADMRLGREERILYNRDSAGIRRSIDKGAHYMFVNGITQLYQKPYLNYFATHLKGKYENILIFDLLSDSTSYKIEEDVLIYNLECDAENISEDGKYFIGDPDSLQFEYGALRTNTESFSGSFSVALWNNNPFGMTIGLPPSKYGEILEITVWKKGSEDKGGIIVSAEDPQVFYDNEIEFVDQNDNGWVKIKNSVFISSELEGLKLKTYLYNPDNDTVFFDDFTIKKYSKGW